MIGNAARIFFGQFASPLIYVLLIAALISVFLGHWVDLLVIMAVVFFNACFGTVQEIKAKRAIAALSSYLPRKAKVKRDGRMQVIEAAEITLDDLLVLEAGDRIGADAQVLESYLLRVNEATLTGESQPRDPQVQDMVYESTLVASGRAIAKVMAVGAETQFGKLSKLTTQAPEIASPLKVRLDRFAKLLAMAVLATTGGVFILGVVLGGKPEDIFPIALALTVSATPEGLPAAVTVILAVGAYRMAKRGAIVRKLAAVEALGSTTVICVDKTGTVTMGEMMVEKIYCNGKIVEVTGSGFAVNGAFFINGQKMDPRSDSQLEQLLIGCALVNDARVFMEGDKIEVIGDPTEAALVVLAQKAGFDQEVLSREYKRVAEFPFDAHLRYMATLHQKQNDGQLVFVKGSAEQVIELCDGELDRQEILRQVEKMALQALRVFALSSHSIKSQWQGITHESIKGKLKFLGLVGIADPPRPEAYQTVKNAQKAGIKVVMITGDYEKTALAIGRQIGLLETGKMVSGKELDLWDDKALAANINQVTVFARTLPEQKMRLVSAYRHNNEIVAMTGDGVNDAPALAAADIGVGMGKSGTDVAKEAADMVITDDNLSTIIAAVEQGKVIMENLRKVLSYLLSTNFGEVLIVAFALGLGLPLPLLAVQILWLNLVTDGFSVAALSLDPQEKGILYKRLPNTDGWLVTKTIVLRIALVSMTMMVGTILLFAITLAKGLSLDYAQTLALVTMAVFQWFNAFNSRSEDLSIATIGIFSNKFLVLAVVANLTMQLAAVYWQPLQQVLGTTALSAWDWGWALLAGGSVVVVEEIRKMIQRRRHSWFALG